MQIIYGFVYYFIGVFISLSFSLLIFVLKPARRLLQTIQTKYQGIINNTKIKYIVNFSFAIIFLILLDSLFSYMKLRGHFDERTNIITQTNTP